MFCCNRVVLVLHSILSHYEAADMCVCVNHSSQGVIPLGGCDVSEEVNGPQKFAIKITHAHFKVSSHCCIITTTIHTIHTMCLWVFCGSQQF